MIQKPRCSRDESYRMSKCSTRVPYCPVTISPSCLCKQSLLLLLLRLLLRLLLLLLGGAGAVLVQEKYVAVQPEPRRFSLRRPYAPDPRLFGVHLVEVMDSGGGDTPGARSADLPPLRCLHSGADVRVEEYDPEFLPPLRASRRPQSAAALACGVGHNNELERAWPVVSAIAVN